MLSTFFLSSIDFCVNSIINPRRVLKVHKLWEHLYTASGCNCIWSLEYKWKMGGVKKFFQEILPPTTNFEIVSCCSNQNYLKLSLSNLTTSHKFSNTRTHTFSKAFSWIVAPKSLIPSKKDNTSKLSFKHNSIHQHAKSSFIRYWGGWSDAKACNALQRGRYVKEEKPICGKCA